MRDSFRNAIQWAFETFHSSDFFSKKLYENLRCAEGHLRTMDDCEEVAMKCFNSIFIKKLIEINSISLGG